MQLIFWVAILCSLLVQSEPIEMSASTVRLHAFVLGKVQGVFMREFTRRESERLGLHGWCRNVLAGERKGQVEIVAEGPRQQLDELVAWIRAGGSPHARVDDVQLEWLVATHEFIVFTVLKSTK